LALQDDDRRSGRSPHYDHYDFPEPVLAHQSGPLLEDGWPKALVGWRAND
jgi:hypothetical protein